MKKSELVLGLCYVLAGTVCLTVALLTESRLDGALFGFAGALQVPGVVMICRYFYWNSPKNKARYQERLENEKIEMRDERNVKLRDKAGRYTYVLGLLVISVSMVVFSVLGVLEIVAGSRLIVLYLGGYLVFQIVAGVVIFDCLSKRY